MLHSPFDSLHIQDVVYSMVYIHGFDISITMTS